FNSTSQNPSLSNPSVSHTGNYTVNVTSAAGCTNVASAHASVVALPVVSFTTNSPRCMGQNLVLNASATTGGAFFSWNGPNAFSGSGPTQTIPNAPVAASGNYVLTVINGPCSANLSSQVTVFALPHPTISYNGPVCEGRSMTVAVNV